MIEPIVRGRNMKITISEQNLELQSCKNSVLSSVDVFGIEKNKLDFVQETAC